MSHKLSFLGAARGIEDVWCPAWLFFTDMDTLLATLVANLVETLVGNKRIMPVRREVCQNWGGGRTLWNTTESNFIKLYPADSCFCWNVRGLFHACQWRAWVLGSVTWCAAWMAFECRMLWAACHDLNVAYLLEFYSSKQTSCKLPYQALTVQDFFFTWLEC